MQPTIRLIEPHDDPFLAAIIRQNLADHQLDLPGTAYFDPELDHLSTFYAQPMANYFTITDATLGVLGGGGYAPYDQTKKIAELQKFYLGPAAKGLGLSYSLLQTIEASAQELGYQQLYLETHHLLSVALHVYQKAGYLEIDGPLQHTQHTTMDRFFVKHLLN
ncbi:MAG TPA: GNAT family N-acetyltransferase [Enterococcus sp.]|uniref:GNAT family N-acetyltransferase n=1 Tax=Enterococcus sp. TaxID=35783 RepID=UPI000EDB52CD|nr:GNAT family N-acetyltransferase [Enterococcus sp.]HCE12375.1 GNAT family N-acetyltransferase [Enterococcus sp.]